MSVQRFGPFNQGQMMVDARDYDRLLAACREAIGQVDHIIGTCSCEVCRPTRNALARLREFTEDK